MLVQGSQHDREVSEKCVVMLCKDNSSVCKHLRN